ncbi:bifunctional DNA primase/helicase [Alkalilimnicola ehrlichii]|uniref:Bifunctional DNA primase/helicase n=1 Tax=Alkalilimnicola ehrlichii TaxID=351052 RepID=A0A3E0X2Z9_9GAMM|nr:toprim domain-containing protein [Alkalilimnicola ehrlichii]RFA31318.1 bifunctional DNA primase/helicase [Alkalilimnicola ehrlichii]RFA39408.1 bifunctional DNA primase/helicase [Alkalilimnicola ehrlichii]
MNRQLHHDITERLLHDLAFKQEGRYLRKGRCPRCEKRELFVAADAPWMVKCGRENNCGAQFHVKELFPDLFDDWSERYSQAGSTDTISPTAVADAYLAYGRGFDLPRIAGWYTQESYYDPQRRIGTATVRFPLANGYWQRLIDKPHRFGRKKAHVGFGTDYAGHWWQPPGVDLAAAEEIWITEGIFDAIALTHHDLVAVSSISSGNYPDAALNTLADACAAAGKERPLLVWALDSDRAGRRYTLKHVKRAREAGWRCAAAQIPAAGRGQRDWNDCHQRGELSKAHLKEYRYHGALLVAPNAGSKALLMYQHNERREFPFAYRNRLFWFKLDLDKYEKARKDLAGDEDAPLTPEQREKALKQAGAIAEIANCNVTALYYLANTVTDESWYYFRVDFPHDGAAVKNTFSGNQLASASEFKKRLLGIAPGAIWTGSSQQLDKLLRDQLSAIKTVATIDYVGYSKEHRAWVFADLAVQSGKVHKLNSEDYFDLGKTALKSLSQSTPLQINESREGYRDDWARLVWQAYGARGVIAAAFWLGSLFAEQIRAEQKSFPFLEIVGEAGAGKSTLIEFLWKLVGRNDYEGFDPSKATLPARARNFAQVSNLPVVLIESDREQDGLRQRQFDWDELKTAYNGRSIRARGMKNAGNDTYEPPFRGTIAISQNAPVNASEAILSRIVHLRFTREYQTPDTRAVAEQLERLSSEHLSRFLLDAITAEKHLLELFCDRAPQYIERLAALPEIRMHRIAKCHGQLMGMVQLLGPGGLDLLPREAIVDTFALLEHMARERQQAINADHPIVQEFWDAFDYIEGLREASTLNHYNPDGRDGQLIAVNLKHFEAEATARGLRVPPSTDLKRHLKTSKVRRFIESNRAVHSTLLSRTVKCWIFEKEKNRS